MQFFFCYIFTFNEFLHYRNFAAQQGAVIVWRMNHHILQWLHGLDLGIFWAVLQSNCTVLSELSLHLKGMFEVVATETRRMKQLLADTLLNEGNKIWSAQLHKDIGSTETLAWSLNVMAPETNLSLTVQSLPFWERRTLAVTTHDGNVSLCNQINLASSLDMFYKKSKGPLTFICQSVVILTPWKRVPYETNRYSVSKKFPQFIKPRVCYCVHKSLSLDPVLTQINPVLTLTPYISTQSLKIKLSGFTNVTAISCRWPV